MLLIIWLILISLTCKTWLKPSTRFWKHRHVVRKSPVFNREGDGIGKDCFHFSDQFDICMESKICYCRTCLVVVKIKFSNKGQTWQRMKLKIHFIWYQICRNKYFPENRIFYRIVSILQEVKLPLYPFHKTCAIERKRKNRLSLLFTSMIILPTSPCQPPCNGQ